MSTFFNTQIQHVSNSIVSITTNINGDIFQNSCIQNNPFKDCKNIYEIEMLQQYQKLLSSDFNIKKVAVNIFEQNYSIIQLPQQIAGINLIQFILSQWYINNPDIKHNVNITIQKEFCNITNFNPIEQTVIYFILIGVYSFKDLCSCFCSNSLLYTARQIRAAIDGLYEKFQTNNKYILAQTLNQHGLNIHVPTTIIKPSIFCV